jgi:hypothetical protein
VPRWLPFTTFTRNLCSWRQYMVALVSFLGGYENNRK